MAQNGTRCRPPYEDQDARISILANGKLPKGRIRFCRLINPSSNCHLRTGRAIRFPPAAETWPRTLVLSIMCCQSSVRPDRPPPSGPLGLLVH